MKDPEELEAYGRYLALVGEAWLLPPNASQLSALALVGDLLGEPDLQVAQSRDLEQSWQQHFRVPGEQNLKPYESAHAAAGGHAVRVAVAELYQQAGFSTSPYEHEPPDHLGHELRFLSSLLTTAAARKRQGELQAANTLSSWVSGFIREHLASFLDAFVATVEKHALHPFFPALARVSSRLVWGVYDGSRDDSGSRAAGGAPSLPSLPDH